MQQEKHLHVVIKFKCLKYLCIRYVILITLKLLIEIYNRSKLSCQYETKEQCTKMEMSKNDVLRQ